MNMALSSSYCFDPKVQFVGNSVMLMKNGDHYQSFQHVSIHIGKSKQINKDLTMTQLSNLQSYFRSVFKRGELT